MRKLQTRDVFAFARLVKASGIEEDLRKAIRRGHEVPSGATEEEIDTVENELGIDVILAIVDGCAQADTEDLFYKFYAGVAEVKESAVKEMELADLIDGFKQLAEENDLLSFFTTAIRLTKK